MIDCRREYSICSIEVFSKRDNALLVLKISSVISTTRSTGILSFVNE